MKKSITRKHAVAMFQQLGQMAFDILEPIFKEEPKAEVDLTELDELLK